MKRPPKQAQTDLLNEIRDVDEENRVRNGSSPAIPHLKNKLVRPQIVISPVPHFVQLENGAVLFENGKRLPGHVASRSPQSTMNSSLRLLPGGRACARAVYSKRLDMAKMPWQRREIFCLEKFCAICKTHKTPTFLSFEMGDLYSAHDTCVGRNLTSPKTRIGAGKIDFGYAGNRSSFI